MNLKQRKNQQGFTLVEVIVVAIIVAALAAVAIPLYNGYVTSSRTNAAANAAGSVASLMGTCVNQGGTASSGSIAAGADIVGPATVTCVITGVSPSPSIAVPSGIIIKISDYSHSPGTVKGKGGTTSDYVDQTYNY